MMLNDYKCIKCNKDLQTTQRTKPQKYCADCKKQKDRERSMKRYYNNKSIQLGLRITKAQKEFVDEQCLNLSKLVRKMLDERMGNQNES